MKLWLISQEANDAYDTFDAAVVAADTEEEARYTNPSMHAWGDHFSTWCSSPDQVTVKLIGEASPDIERGVVLGSFNAG